MSRIAARRRVTRVTVGSKETSRADYLAVEEPLEIRVQGKSLAVTMRTPGHDVELAHGFLVSEGVITAGEDTAAARYCAGATYGSGAQALPFPMVTELGLPPDAHSTHTDQGNTYNVLDVTLAPGVPLPDPSLERNFMTTSSCGLCGKASIDAVHTQSRFAVDEDPLELSAEQLTTFPDKLREHQAVFRKTGGLHAAALFDAKSGDLLVAREDVGRHNAVDKVIGWAAMQNRLPLRGTVLMVSARASFELTQKAVMAGIPMLAAVSAASSLAADLATESGLTLVGFLRGPSMVIYSRSDRIITGPADGRETQNRSHDNAVDIDAVRTTRQRTEKVPPA